MEFGIPKYVEICGELFAVRYDFRVILEIFIAMSDKRLTDQERSYVVISMFYPDAENIPDYNEAIQKMIWFINCGQEDQPGTQTRLVDWEKDYQIIISPVNRILGFESRSVEYDPEKNTGGLHWWTFMAAYREIGDCLFAQIVNIRNKRAKGKKLDKSEQEFYNRNKAIIDIDSDDRYTEEAFRAINEWIGPRKSVSMH